MLTLAWGSLLMQRYLRVTMLILLRFCTHIILEFCTRVTCVYSINCYNNVMYYAYNFS